MPCGQIRCSSSSLKSLHPATISSTKNGEPKTQNESVVSSVVSNKDDLSVKSTNTKGQESLKERKNVASSDSGDDLSGKFCQYQLEKEIFQKKSYLPKKLLLKSKKSGDSDFQTAATSVSSTQSSYKSKRSVPYHPSIERGYSNTSNSLDEEGSELKSQGGISAGNPMQIVWDDKSFSSSWYKSDNPDSVSKTSSTCKSSLERTNSILAEGSVNTEYAKTLPFGGVNVSGNDIESESKTPDEVEQVQLISRNANGNDLEAIKQHSSSQECCPQQSMVLGIGSHEDAKSRSTHSNAMKSGEINSTGVMNSDLSSSKQQPSSQAVAQNSTTGQKISKSRLFQTGQRRNTPQGTGSWHIRSQGSMDDNSLRSASLPQTIQVIVIEQDDIDNYTFSSIPENISLKLEPRSIVTQRTSPEVESNVGPPCLHARTMSKGEQSLGQRTSIAGRTSGTTKSSLQSNSFETRHQSHVLDVKKCSTRSLTDTKSASYTHDFSNSSKFYDMFGDGESIDTYGKYWHRKTQRKLLLDDKSNIGMSTGTPSCKSNTTVEEEVLSNTPIEDVTDMAMKASSFISKIRNDTASCQSSHSKKSLSGATGDDSSQSTRFTTSRKSKVADNSCPSRSSLRGADQSTNISGGSTTSSKKSQNTRTDGRPLQSTYSVRSQYDQPDVASSFSVHSTTLSQERNSSKASHQSKRSLKKPSDESCSDACHSRRATENPKDQKNNTEIVSTNDSLLLKNEITLENISENKTLDSKDNGQILERSHSKTSSCKRSEGSIAADTMIPFVIAEQISEKPYSEKVSAPSYLSHFVENGILRKAVDAPEITDEIQLCWSNGHVSLSLENLDCPCSRDFSSESGKTSRQGQVLATPTTNRKYFSPLAILEERGYMLKSLDPPSQHDRNLIKSTTSIYDPPTIKNTTTKEGTVELKRLDPEEKGFHNSFDDKIQTSSDPLKIRCVRTQTDVSPRFDEPIVGQQASKVSSGKLMKQVDTDFPSLHENVSGINVSTKSHVSRSQSYEIPQEMMLRQQMFSLADLGTNLTEHDAIISATNSKELNQAQRKIDREDTKPMELLNNGELAIQLKSEVHMQQVAEMMKNLSANTTGNVLTVLEKSQRSKIRSNALCMTFPCVKDSESAETTGLKSYGDDATVATSIDDICRPDRYAPAFYDFDDGEQLIAKLTITPCSGRVKHGPPNSSNITEKETETPPETISNHTSTLNGGSQKQNTKQIIQEEMLKSSSSKSPLKANTSKSSSHKQPVKDKAKVIVAKLSNVGTRNEKVQRISSKLTSGSTHAGTTSKEKLRVPKSPVEGIRTKNSKKFASPGKRVLSDVARKRIDPKAEQTSISTPVTTNRRKQDEEHRVQAQSQQKKKEQREENITTTNPYDGRVLQALNALKILKSTDSVKYHAVLRKLSERKEERDESDEYVTSRDESHEAPTSPSSWGGSSRHTYSDSTGETMDTFSDSILPGSPYEEKKEHWRQQQQLKQKEVGQHTKRNSRVTFENIITEVSLEMLDSQDTTDLGMDMLFGTCNPTPIGGQLVHTVFGWHRA